MNFESSYTSCATNQTPTVTDWGKNNLICYGSCNAVYIYDVQWGSGGKIIKTLCGHTKRINSVRWIRGIDHETELVSGSTDGTAIVWSYKHDKYVPFILEGHKGNVNIVDGLYKEPDQKYAVVLTASLDNTVKIWSRITVDDDFVESQNIDFGFGLCMSLKLSVFSYPDVFLLACGLDNSKVQLYVEDNHEFACALTLEGHENWVRGLDFTTDGSDIILASSSQDTSIRLWRITSSSKLQYLLEDDFVEDTILRKTTMVMKGVEYIVSLESLLASHEAWIYSVSWNTRDFTLLSASLDKSMIIWEHDPSSGLWLEKVRVGEVGGSTLGFYGGMFGPTGTSILAHGYHGGFHIWNYCAKADVWQPTVTIGGHFNEVIDLSWEPKGEFLISVSTDQTTRVHAPWSLNSSKTTWHEIARPQIHGYDMSCLAILSRYHFASGAEEKIIRIFSAPNNFVQNFKRLCKITDDDAEINYIAPEGAAVPSLGLSNKAVYEQQNTDRAMVKSTKEPYAEESHFQAIELTNPPTEETLMQNTLWPEIQKLYGHGYEVYSLAASPDKLYLASACKATNVEHASILLWDTETWQVTQTLPSHNLTVAQLAFSPNSCYLLSVSRDRRWTLFCKDSLTSLFKSIATTDKKTGIHSRIIWCCAWTHDSKYFATGSRDGKVAVWTIDPNKISTNVLGQVEPASKHLELKGESITALTFAPTQLSDGSYLIGVGLESGIIKVFEWSLTKWKLMLTLDQCDAHHLTVKRLAFRPVLGEAGNLQDDNVLQLASCGSDFVIRVNTIYIK